MAKRKANPKNKEPLEASLRAITAKDRRAALRRFLGTMWRANPGLASVRFGLTILAAALQPLQVYVFALLITAIGNGDAAQGALLVPAVIALFLAHRLANDVAQSWIDGWFDRSVSLKANEEIYAHMAKLPPEALNDPSVRRDLDFVREDLWRINNLPRHVELMVRSSIQILGAVSLGLLAPWWVLAMVFGISVLQAVNARGESRRDVWNATWNTYDGRRVEYTRYLFLVGDDFREIRLLDAAERVLRAFRASAARILARFRRVAIRSASARAGLAVLLGLAYAVIIAALVPPAFENPAELAVIFISINLFGLLGDGLNQFANASGHLRSDLTILARVQHLLTFPAERDEGASLPAGPLVIEFRDVSYRYPGASKDALSRLSLTIREGEHLAVVGENGAGKSTFLRLLAGLDQPTKGEIFVSGKPLGAYRPGEWRRAFHLMLQDSKLFQDYLGQNLRYGEGAGKWKRAGFPLQKSLSIAGADLIVRELENGLGAFLGDWATPPGVTAQKVSGGQTQRLVIARTLIHGGRFICFDEPTSAMDALAETAFFERLHDALSDRGIIYISHRFSTVRRASRILVFEKGRMIEDGSHEALLAKEGMYARLYREQAKWYS